MVFSNAFVAKLLLKITVYNLKIKVTNFFHLLGLPFYLSHMLSHIAHNCSPSSVRERWTLTKSQTLKEVNYRHKWLLVWTRFYSKLCHIYSLNCFTLYRVLMNWLFVQHFFGGGYNMGDMFLMFDLYLSKWIWVKSTAKACCATL